MVVLRFSLTTICSCSWSNRVTPAERCLFHPIRCGYPTVSRRMVIFHGLFGCERWGSGILQLQNLKSGYKRTKSHSTVRLDPDAALQSACCYHRRRCGRIVCGTEATSERISSADSWSSAPNRGSYLQRSSWWAAWFAMVNVIHFDSFR